MPFVPCYVLSLDILDVTGVHVVDVGGSLLKQRLDSNGRFIGTTQDMVINVKLTI